MSDDGGYYRTEFYITCKVGLNEGLVSYFQHSTWISKNIASLIGTNFHVDQSIFLRCAIPVVCVKTNG